MRKRFIPKRKIKYRYIIPILLILIILLIFRYIEDNVNISLPNKSLIIYSLKAENNYSYGGLSNTHIPLQTYEYVKDNIFNSPINMLKNQLNNNKNSKQETMLSFLYVKNEIKKDPLIYIYNSHQGETYSSEYLEDYNIVPDVLMAANILKDKLENININTVVENSNILAYMVENKLDHSGSYIASRVFLEKAMTEYPNAKLYIDLHRDAASHEMTYIDINGKPCAKILFVIGLEYDTYQENLNVVTKLNNISDNKYPGLSRGIIKKQGHGVNGVYNQDLASNVILIEMGGNENNIEEVNNTLDLVANIIGDYVNEKE